jgi:uncharacterized phage protein gp47/JayE
MADFGITPQGFNRKRLDEILAELEAEFKSAYGDNFNVSPDTPDGQTLGSVAEAYANLWEIGEISYNAFNPNAATDITLSNLVTLNGIERNEATATTVSIDVTGTGNTTIPSGSLVGDPENTSVDFIIQEDIVLDGAGDGSGEVVADTTGPIVVLSNTITEIRTPVTGWDTVDNSSDGITGVDEETDVQLRARRNRSTAAASQTLIDSIFSAVANVNGVTQLTVIENDTAGTVDGIPEKSFLTSVVGGDDTEIATAIAGKKPTGIQAFGTTSVDIPDNQGIDHPIGFSRPTQIPIFIEVEITVDSDFPEDGDETIKQNIVDYANGVLVEGQGFFLADDVLITRLYTPINRVQGHFVDALFVDTDNPPTGTANISIGSDEVAVFLVDNIDVAHV